MAGGQALKTETQSGFGLINEDSVMERMVIRGGRRLKGTVKISGAKNAVLKLMAAALLANRYCLIRNVPKIHDVETMIGVLRGLGAAVSWADPTTLLIDASRELGYFAPDEYVREMRASVQVMGPLLSRAGEVKLFQPGGCIIGQRPIDLHLKGFQTLGAQVIEDQGYVHVKANRLQGAEIHLDFPSVGATENLMAAAILAEGTTIIRNAAREPEIIEEQNFYNRLGARIRGAGTETIRIEGVTALNTKEIDYTVIPDRIETGTFMIAAAISGGDLILEEVIPEHVEALSAKLREIGVELELEADRIRVRAGAKLKAADITVMPHPNFPTDLQPQITALLSIAEGTSAITENVFGGRFRYVDELIRMGAMIKVESRSAIVKGVTGLIGAEVFAPDLRAGAALVIAGLAAEGETVIEGLQYLDRGYEKLEEKLAATGADVKRVKVEG
jgi:UDP-N-acetylglucosamine 1-carboxyvinyltransferase